MRHVFLHFIWPCFGLWATTVSEFETGVGLEKLSLTELAPMPTISSYIKAFYYTWQLALNTKTSLCVKSLIIVWKLGSLHVQFLNHPSRLVSFVGFLFVFFLFVCLVGWVVWFTYCFVFFFCGGLFFFSLGVGSKNAWIKI